LLRGSGIVAPERAAKLYRAEAELITELVGSFGKPIELFAAVGIEKVELYCAVVERGECDTEKADFSLGIAMSAK
jgi:hypothetical protein